MPFEIEHARMIDYRADQDVFALGGDADRFLMAASLYPAATILYQGQVVLFGGVTPVWQGVGAAWLRVSSIIDDYPVMAFKHVSGFLNYATEKLALHRVQAVVKFGVHKHMRWASRMGFQPEGICRRMGPDKSDYAIVARLV